MSMKSLRVLHHLKRQSVALPAAPAHVFCVDTCQRALWFYKDAEGSLPLGIENFAQAFEGPDAYRFMLRVATGLESEVQGETDVFGQLKSAWAARPIASMQTWIQKIFEDTKEIRALYLQNTGGSSYGSLVRKLLRGHSTGPQEKILVVGAGHLARSVSPLLVENELWILNRNTESARELARELVSRHGAQVRVIVGEAEERQAWREASHAVVCIPTDAVADRARIHAWEQGLPVAGGRSVVHLGGLKEACQEWNRLPHFHPLDDVFSLQKSLGENRAEQFDRAADACDEKALLRSLSGHAWEDLAAFA